MIFLKLWLTALIALACGAVVLKVSDRYTKVLNALSNAALVLLAMGVLGGLLSGVWML